MSTMTSLLVIAGGVLLFVVVRFLRANRSVHACARTGRVARLRELLVEEPALIQARNPEGETPMHQAAKYGELEALRFLIAQGGDVNASANQGVTPLHLAAGFGELETVKLLLEQGAEVDPKEAHGMTPIMAAQAQDHRAVIEVLRSAGANAEAVPPLADLGGEHFLAAIADDDPLMRLATTKARAALPLLRALFEEHPRDAMVKFAFASDSGQTEHLWADLIELGGDTFKARVKTLPVTHRGPFQRTQARSVIEIEDWQVELRDGQIRGGFGFQVVFHRTQERSGQLPSDAAAHAGRFVDHDIATLLHEAGDA